jgi:hypothetical protein
LLRSAPAGGRALIRIRLAPSIGGHGSHGEGGTDASAVGFVFGEEGVMAEATIAGSKSARLGLRAAIQGETGAHSLTGRAARVRCM